MITYLIKNINTLIIIVDRLMYFLYNIIIRLIKSIRELIKNRGGNNNEKANLHLRSYYQSSQKLKLYLQMRQRILLLKTSGKMVVYPQSS